MFDCFKNFTFSPLQDFEPSSPTREKWLYTHKAAKKGEGYFLPGCFQTENGSRGAGIFAIFVLELFAFFLFLSEGGAPILVALSIILDFIFAIWGHYFERPIILARNRLEYTRDQAQRHQQEGILKRSRNKQRIVYSLIWLSAGFKIVSFWGTKGTFDVMVLAVFVFYALGAWLHTLCTGYMVYYWFHFNCGIWKNYRAWSSGVAPIPYKIDLVNPLSQRLGWHMPDLAGYPTDLRNAAHEQGWIMPLNLVPRMGLIRHGIELVKQDMQVNYLEVMRDHNGQILHDPTGAVITTPRNHIFQNADVYFLRTFGILTDDHLINLIALQPHDGRAVVAVKGIEHQIEMILINGGPDV